MEPNLYSYNYSFNHRTDESDPAAFLVPQLVHRRKANPQQACDFASQQQQCS